MSGSEVIKILVDHYGWSIHRRKGSHVTLKKGNVADILTVPMHKELDQGTLNSILRKADIAREHFLEKR